LVINDLQVLPWPNAVLYPAFVYQNSYNYENEIGSTNKNRGFVRRIPPKSRVSAPCRSQEIKELGNGENE
jgi:hypothetical protein